MSLDSFFSNLFNTSDPASAARLRGGLIGAAQALSQPYGNFGSALVGGAQGAQQARQDYTQQQFQDLRMQQLQDQLSQDKAKRAALNSLFLKGPQQTAAPIAPAPQEGIAPAAPVQAAPNPLPIAPQPSAVPPQAAAQAPQAPIAGAQAQAPAFHLPAGFESPEQFQAYAQINPEDALKRMFPDQEKPMVVAPGSHVIDPRTYKEVYSAPEKPNPNQPFNPDGTPNAAYQAYEQAKMKAQQAPAWANVDIARQKLARAASGLIEPETLSFMAQQVLAGDKSPYANIGRGAQGAENLAALRKEVMTQARERGLGGADLAALNAEFSGLQAGERTLGTRTANVEMAASEAQQMMPIALAASARVDRTQYPTLNKIKLAVDKGVGDENVVRFNQANNALVNTYARAISPSGTPTVSDKEHAREILETAYSKGQYAAAVDQMQQEIAAARRSPGSVRGEFRGAISGKTSGVAAVPDAPNSPQPKSQMLPKPKTPADAAKLKPGTHFLDGNGVERIR